MKRNTIIILFFIIIICGLVYLKFRKNDTSVPQKSAVNVNEEIQPEVENTTLIPKTTSNSTENTSDISSTTSEIPQPQIITNKPSDSPFVEGELILRVSNDAVMKQLESQLEEKGITVLRRVDQLGLIRVKLPDGMKADEMKKILSEMDDIKESLPNVKTEVPRDVNNIPMFDNGKPITAVSKNGNELLKNTDPAIRAELGNNVIVALLDTGVDDTHPDLTEKTLQGYNFVDDNAITDDVNSHGTACAGIIIGNGKNSDSARGVAPAAYLLPVKVMDDNGKGNSFAVIEGIVYAVDRGAKVINLSIGTAGDSKILREAIDYAIKKGAVVIAAAGNDGKETTLLPAGYEDVICVGAIDGRKSHAPFSNFGDKIDVVAPGVAVYTTAPDNGYKSFTGTSAAAPFVSGAVAALLSQNPRISPAEAMEIVLNRTDNLGPANRDILFGNGIVNVKRLLEKDSDSVHDAALTTLYFEPANLVPGSDVKVHFVIQNQGNRTISFGKFLYEIGEEKKEISVRKLNVGECEEITLPWTVPLEKPQKEMRIQGYFKISEADDEPKDNGQAVILQRADWQ